MAWKKIVDKKRNQDYQGHAEKCTYTFSLGPEQIPGMGWAAQQVINSHNDALAKAGSQLLELRVWEDTAPIWQTNYYVEVIATASPLWWNIIIAGALFLLIGLAIWFTIKEVKDIVEYIGAKVPEAIPLMAIAGIGLVGLAIILVLKRE